MNVTSAPGPDPGRRSRPGQPALTGDQDRLGIAATPAGGAGQITVLFLHGMGVTAGSWAQVRARVEPCHPTMAYDQRGHGASPFGALADPTITQLGSDLCTVLDSAALPGPVVLVGHSVGGMAIMAAAAQRQDLFRSTVAGIVLVSTSARGMELGCGLPGAGGELVRRSFLGLTHGATLHHRGLAGHLAAWLSRLAVSAMTTYRWPLYGRSADAAVRRECSALIAATRPETLHTLLPQLSAHNAEDITPLRAIPSLVVVGDEDRFMPTTHSRELLALLPRARLVVVPRAGHVLPLECPQLLAQEISSFTAGL